MASFARLTTLGSYSETLVVRFPISSKADTAVIPSSQKRSVVCWRRYLSRS